jgi:PII-like signaling protein
VNIFGAFLLGYFITRLQERLPLSAYRRPLLGTGFCGAFTTHPPHGDRLLQLRRRVPIVTIVVDRPGRIAESFEIVDELTDEVGLVTSELVPATTALSEEGPSHGELRLARHRF